MMENLIPSLRLIHEDGNRLSMSFISIPIQQRNILRILFHKMQSAYPLFRQ